MNITVTYNLRTEESEAQGELYRDDEIRTLVEAIRSLGYETAAIDVSGPTATIVNLLLESKPDLIFNLAEGSARQGIAREAYFPAVFELLDIPYTGGGPALLSVCLDKRMSVKLLDIHGVSTPSGAFISAQHPEIPEHLPYPLFVKPNYEGTSKGISQQSVVENKEQLQERVKKLLEEYASGIVVEQFIPGRELSVPFLDFWPDKFLEIVEHDLSEANGEHNIYDYNLKQNDEGVKVICPAELDRESRLRVFDCAEKIRRRMPAYDLGRIDLRLHEDGTPYFIEINPLPRLMPDGSLMAAAKEKGLDMPEVMDCIIRSAARRNNIPVRPKVPVWRPELQERKGARELGIVIGRYPPGPHNAITDVEGIQVGHVTHCEDNLPDPDDPEKKTCTRTGITAIVPQVEQLFNNHLMAGGFVLNGIGEMSGLTQAMEWGWLETPILLTNTMSVGTVHNGIIDYLIQKHPELGRKIDVVIPLVAETNDSFLNDVRLSPNTAAQAVQAIGNAAGGPVEQGSVGAGTGMISFDFAGGIGSASRRLPEELGGYTAGVLVLSNFGKMRDLTVDGYVAGRELDPMYPMNIRRGETYGSAIVVVATDAPLLSSQLSRLAKRAALGLGRAGSYAASTSGEIIFAFSTGNSTSREAKEQAERLSLECLTDAHINPLYEAVIESTQEAVLNAMFYSAGQTGRSQRTAPAIPSDYLAQRFATVE
jgi:D-alanine--D-alanine ligase